jgi:hypothetical protein
MMHAERLEAMVDSRVMSVGPFVEFSVKPGES